MCQYNEKKMVKARKDHEVFKVVEKQDGQFRGPFFPEFHFNYEKLLSVTDMNRMSVHGFHACRSLRSAKVLLNILIKESELKLDKEFVICKATIPKGSLYIKGNGNFWETEYTSIRSNQIIVHKPN